MFHFVFRILLLSTESFLNNKIQPFACHFSVFQSMTTFYIALQNIFNYAVKRAYFVLSVLDM